MAKVDVEAVAVEEGRKQGPDSPGQADVCSGAGPKASNYDNPEDKLWSVYVAEAAEYDNALVENWKTDMDAILIFVRIICKVFSSNPVID